MSKSCQLRGAIARRTRTDGPPPKFLIHSREVGISALSLSCGLSLLCTIHATHSARFAVWATQRTRLRRWPCHFQLALTRSCIGAQQLGHFYFILFYFVFLDAMAECLHGFLFVLCHAKLCYQMGRLAPLAAEILLEGRL